MIEEYETKCGYSYISPKLAASEKIINPYTKPGHRTVREITPSGENHMGHQ